MFNIQRISNCNRHQNIVREYEVRCLPQVMYCILQPTAVSHLCTGWVWEGQVASGVSQGNLIQAGFETFFSSLQKINAASVGVEKTNKHKNLLFLWSWNWRPGIALCWEHWEAKSVVIRKSDSLDRRSVKLHKQPKALGWGWGWGCFGSVQIHKVQFLPI